MAEAIQGLKGGSMPRQFVNQSFTFVQPDGTTVAARGSGNQHHAVFEDERGYTIVLDPVSGYYQYARASADGSSLEPSGAIVGKVDPAALGLPKGAEVALGGAHRREAE
jgi:hypothetical protein